MNVASFTDYSDLLKVMTDVMIRSKPYRIHSIDSRDQVRFNWNRHGSFTADIYIFLRGREFSAHEEIALADLKLTLENHPLLKAFASKRTLLSQRVESYETYHENGSVSFQWNDSTKTFDSFSIYYGIMCRASGTLNSNTKLFNTLLNFLSIEIDEEPTVWKLTTSGIRDREITFRATSNPEEALMMGRFLLAPVAFLNGTELWEIPTFSLYKEYIPNFDQTKSLYEECMKSIKPIHPKQGDL